MKYASQDLRDEHEVILYGLEILEELADRLEDRQPVEIEDLEALVDFLKQFADRCHHGKEEGLYFASLEKAGIPRQNGPIGVMLTEHIEGRSYIARMTTALTDVYSPHDFATAARSYVELLRNHIGKENQVLFMMGDQRLPEDEQDRLLTAFEAYEADVMGPDSHEKFHATIERLGKKYLS